MRMSELPPGWAGALSEEESKPYFRALRDFIAKERRAGKVIYPAPEAVFRALRAVDLPDVRVVMLGQDPYHGEGQALGLAFAVPNALVRKPPSLVNILKELRTDLACDLPPAASDLTGWTEQGVLLLNTLLTVEAGRPLSHRDRGWERFTDRVIEVLNARAEPVLFILWGSHAQKKKAMLDLTRHAVLESPHPSPLSARRGFFGSRVFSRANQILAGRWGQPPIEWQRISGDPAHGLSVSRVEKVSPSSSRAGDAR